MSEVSLRDVVPCPGEGAHPYRVTSLIRKRTPLGPCRKPMPRVLGEASMEGACVSMHVGSNAYKRRSLQWKTASG